MTFTIVKFTSPALSTKHDQHFLQGALAAKFVKKNYFGRFFMSQKVAGHFAHCAISSFPINYVLFIHSHKLKCYHGKY